MTIAVKTRIGSPQGTTRRVHTIQVVREEAGAEDVVLFAASRNSSEGMSVAAHSVIATIRSVADNVERELVDTGIIAIAEPAPERVQVFRKHPRPTGERPIGASTPGLMLDRAIVHLELEDLADPSVQAWLRGIATRLSDPRKSTIELIIGGES